MSRFFPTGERIAVECDTTGTPCGFTWQGARHTVQIVAARWRIDENWHQARVWREYFRVATDRRVLCLLFHDLPDGAWYLQRVYD